MTSTNRIGHLDGIRGIAISTVILYHAYARWDWLVPYHADYKNIWLFKFGYLGVPLFFLLSGYVILMTLDRCVSFGHFLKKRWLRLFPAMFIVTLLVYFSAILFPERPAGSPTLLQTIPGLTLIDPKIIQRIIGIPMQSIEGAFWSIYVETKFYIYIGLVFFYLNKRNIPFYLILPFVFHNLLPLCGDSLVIHKLKTMSMLFSFEYFGWFSIGSALYYYVQNNQRFWLKYAGIMTLPTAYLYQGPDVFIPALIVSIFFILSTQLDSLKKILSFKLFTFIGVLSYPLYLIHENMLVASIIKLDAIQVIPDFFLPLLPILGLLVVSYFIAFRLENPIRRSIQLALDRFQNNNYKK